MCKLYIWDEKIMHTSKKLTWLFSLIIFAYFEYAPAFPQQSDSVKIEMIKSHNARILQLAKSIQDSLYREALTYAPILWFADKEQYFPTLPFFSAFDGRNNNDKNGQDFLDSEEIAPLNPKLDTEHIDWGELHDWYKALLPDKRKELVTVFYNVDSIKAGELGGILNSDEQFWLRQEEYLKKRTLDYFERDSNKVFAVYEYYFYFIKDFGLQGHPEDLESVFIFVPRDATEDSVRIAVGLGHFNNTPNNVLFYSNKEKRDGYGEHLHFLVELGGHSHAPDFDINGWFDPGIDANWHVENLWGTRDVQAISGGGYTGQYATWMTLPRDQNHKSNKLFPPDSGLLEKQQYYFYGYRLLPAKSLSQLNFLLEKYEAMDSSKNSILEQDENWKKKFEKKGLDDEYTKWKKEVNFDSVIVLNKHYPSANAQYEEWRKLAKTEFVSFEDFSRFMFFLKQYTKIRDNELKVLREIKNNLEIITGDDKGLDAMLSEASLVKKFKADTTAVAPQLQHLLLWKRDLIKAAPKIDCQYDLGLWGGRTMFKGRKYFQANLAAAMYDRLFNTRIPLYGALELHVGWEHPDKMSIALFHNVSYTKWLSPYAGISHVTKPSHWVGELGLSLTVPISFPKHDALRRINLRLGVRFERRNEFLLNAQLGLHMLRAIPHTTRPYLKLLKKKHQIWEHADYGKPNQVFKNHIFRPRFPGGLGIWSGVGLERKLKWEVLKLTWLVAPEFFPMRLSGVIETQAGPIYNFEKKAWGGTIGFYYHGFYGRWFSGYVNLFTLTKYYKREYSLGAGLSIMPPALSTNPDKIHWLQIRLGLRSDFAKSSFELIHHRFELQLGVHY